MLEGAEFAPAGGSSVDLDGNGRITLGELARAKLAAERAETTSAESTAPQPSFTGARVLADGDLAALLVGVDPYKHDQDEKTGLSRAETERAFFDALDLDDDGKLTRDELSRCPGDSRALRFGDRAAVAGFDAVDKNRDGRVTAREFRLGDAEWEALDADRDGMLRLVEPRLPEQRTRGLVLAGSEWPVLRPGLVLLPPGITLETLLATFDRDGDEVLDQRELKTRADLLFVSDDNRDQRSDRTELGRLLARLDDEGVHMLADDFLGRWDLDGSGTVEAEELPPGVRLRLKLE
jgi:Ca2+-binding EF-hand superfamily protein